MGEVPLKVCHPLAVHPLILSPQLGLAFWGGVWGVILPAQILMGAILQDSLIGKLPLALGEVAVAPVPLAVPCLYLAVFPPLLSVVLVDVRLELLVGIFLYGHVGAVGPFQSVDDDHIVLDKRGGHIGRDGADAVDVQGVLGG